MNRIERQEMVDQLESMVSFHEDKANYYHEWLASERIKLATIGFNTDDCYLIEEIKLQTVPSAIYQTKDEYSY